MTQASCTARPRQRVSTRRGISPPIRWRVFGFGAALLVAPSFPGASAQPAHSKLTIHAGTSDVAPGEEVTLALKLKLDRGWHTYWVNSGDAGFPVVVEWGLPQGFSAGPLQWPAPRLQPFETGMSYGFNDELVVTSRISAPPTLPGKVEIVANASWLVCADVCIPTGDSVALTLGVRTGDGAPASGRASSQTRAAADSALVSDALRRLPVSPDGWTVRGTWIDTAYRVEVTSSELPAMAMPYFFVDSGGVIDHAAPQRVAVGTGVMLIELRGASTSQERATHLSGVIVSDIRAPESAAYNVAVNIDTSPALAPGEPDPAFHFMETGGIGWAAGAADVAAPGRASRAPWLLALAVGALMILFAVRIRARR